MGAVFEKMHDKANYLNRRLLRRFAPGGDTTFFSPEDFEWLGVIEDNWQLIRADLDVVLGDLHSIPSFQDVSRAQNALTEGDDWKTFILMARGAGVPDAIERCPDTFRLIQQIPGVDSALFSILAPGKRLEPHDGPTAAVLRYHLGLRIPEGDCGIRVGGDERRWHEGKSLVFDDSFEHEAWNNTSEVRGILFVDFVRPLPFPYSVANRATFGLHKRSQFSQEIVANATTT